MGGAACSNCDTPGKASSQALPALMSKPRLQLEPGPDAVSITELIPDNRGRIDDFYEVDRQDFLGEGSFSIVYRCVNRDTKQERAVKMIQRRLISNLSQVEREPNLMRVLDHPNVLRLIETFEDAKSIQLVLERCDGGELFDCIVDSSPFSESVAGSCMQQMLRAMAYLHANDIMHRDAKAENWLLTEDEPLAKAHLKLCDFGCARKLASGEEARTRIGSPYYVAPEVIQGCYNSKADIWALGVNLYMLLGGDHPFAGSNTEEVLYNVKVKELGKSMATLGMQTGSAISVPAQSLLLSMLSRKAEARPSALECLMDPWFLKGGKPKTGQGPGRMDDDVGALENLLNFGAPDGRLHKAILYAGALQADHKALRGLMRLFAKLDDSNLGTLGPRELASGLRQAGLMAGEEEVTSLLEALDVDGSGAVDFLEFVMGAIGNQHRSSDNAGWRIFKMYDLNSNGFLDRMEIASMLALPGVRENREASLVSSEKAINRILDQYDTNKDGKLDFKEFTVLLQQFGIDPQ